MKFKTTYLLMGLAAMAAMLGACNEESTTYETYDSYSNTSTLIVKFNLQSNSEVASGLDSVHFTIDQNKALIYNADSLPVGADVSRMAINLSLGSTVRSVKIHVTNGKIMKDSTFYFSSTTTDSIDFTGNVTFTTSSYDQMFTREYHVKVNVHQTEPDTLCWPQKARRDLPGATTAPETQRVTRQGDRYFSLVEQGGSYRLAVTSEPEGTWETTTLSLPFTPQVESFNGSDDALYLLSQDGTLYASSDAGATWNDCGVVWNHIVGCYQGKVLGIYADGDSYRHDEYPRPEGFVPVTADAAFPIAESSPIALATYTWSVQPQAMMMGGVTAKGAVTNAVWGYDGTTWAQISLPTSALPALRGAVLIPYYSYKKVTGNFIPQRITTWLVLGGKRSDGTMNTSVYSSLDQGLRWAEGATCLQLPSHFTPTAGAQALVADREITSEGSTWTCPFIYYYGGRSANGGVVNNSWQGVYNRLLFKPIY